MSVLRAKVGSTQVEDTRLLFWVILFQKDKWLAPRDTHIVSVEWCVNVFAGYCQNSVSLLTTIFFGGGGGVCWVGFDAGLAHIGTQMCACLWGLLVEGGTLRPILLNVAEAARHGISIWAGIPRHMGARD